MTKTVKRLSVISLVSILLAVVVFSGSVPARFSNAATAAATSEAAAAGTQAAANLPATKPVIQVELNGSQIAGLVGSSCWPNANPECNFVDDPQPDQGISVANGDTLTVKVDPNTPVPQTLQATLLDDKETSGDPKLLDLATTNGVFKVDGLSDGNHRLQIDAIYTGELSGSQPFVTYVYLLKVGAGAGSSTSASGTSAATVVATAAVSETAVVTTAATVSTVAPATAEATASPAATQAATSVATTAATTAAPATSATTVATQAATVKTQAATMAVSAVVVTTAPTVAPTTQPLATTAVPSPTPIAPTVVPTVAPTTAPTVVPTTVPATEATVVASTAETAATAEVVPASPTPTTSGAPAGSARPVAPAMTLVVSGRNYTPIAVSACVLGDGGEQTCVNRPQNAAAQRIVAGMGDVAQINFKGPRPISALVNIASSDGTTILNKQSLRPDNLMLYNLPTTPGSYILSVEVTWPMGKATYYYRLAVAG